MKSAPVGRKKVRLRAINNIAWGIAPSFDVSDFQSVENPRILNLMTSVRLEHIKNRQDKGIFFGDIYLNVKKQVTNKIQAA